MSLRLRLVLLVLLSSVPLLGITLYTAREIGRAEAAAAQTEMQGLARIAESNLRRMLAASEGLLVALSEVPALARGDTDACSRMYEQTQRSSNQNTSLVVTDANGKARCDNHGPTSALYVGDRDYFKQARATRHFSVGAPVVSRLSGRTVVPIAYPLVDAQGNFRGVIASGIDLTSFAQVFAESLANRDLILNVWDPEGTLLYPPAQGTSGVETDSGIRRAVLGRQAQSVSVEAPGPNGVANFYVITGLEREVGVQAALSVGIPMSVLLERSNRAISQILVYFGIVFVVCIAVALALAEFTVRRRVVALSVAAQRMADGDLGARSGIPHSRDELGRLAKGFDAMGENLQVRTLELRRAHQIAKLAHVVTGAGGVFVNSSDTLPGMVGVEPGAMPRNTREWMALVHPADQHAFRAKAIEAGITGARVDVEYRIRRQDGQWIHIRQVIEPIEAPKEADEAGAHWFCTLQDVSVQKQTEQRIRTQLEHLNLLDRITRSIGERQDLPSIFQVVVRTLEESMPLDFACVCLHEGSSSVLQVAHLGAKNAGLLHHLALSEHATIPVDANGLSRCLNGELVYEPDLARLAFPFPERLVHAGLNSMVLAPLRSESNVFGLLVAARSQAQAFSSAECEFLRQLSEHVALAAQHAQLYGALQQAYDDLRQSQQLALQQERLRSLGQMASGIAHDINNALSPVSLYTESLLETEAGLSDRARGHLETIQRAVDDVAHTVARMREFYRQREEQLELASVDLSQLAKQVIDLTRARWHDMAQQGGIVIRVLAELAAEPATIMGVESEIREALTNLVFNAVDAMPEGGTLTLRTRLARSQAGANSVIVEVVDTGSGMDEETRLRCLEPFFTTKGERGTGLGLAMVFGIVQRHSAELEIDSAPGSGTTIRLVFAAPAAALAEPGMPDAARRPPSRLRLLLVDDDPILLKSLRDALETDGHAIVTANGGQSGIAAFRASLERGEEFAAVVTDLGMPHVDGRRVAAAIKEASPATPVILLTGWGQRLIDDGDQPPNVDRVLAKPPKLRELREALAALCQSANH